MTVPAEQPAPASPVSQATPLSEAPGSASPARKAGSGWRVDLLLIGGLALLAFVVRWPNLWLVPRFTDETLEVLHSLAIVRDGARPLTNYDSYYGALYNYVVALALLVSGESPLAPRVVLLLAGVATVVATYLLGSELGRRLATSTQDAGEHLIGPRLVGLLAAGLLATNAPHVVVNSHVAWSNCLTPLLTTLAFWALFRAVRPPTPRPPPIPPHGAAARREHRLRRRPPLRGIPVSLAGEGEPGRLSSLSNALGRASGGGGFLLLSGLLLGLALQTHPLVVALLPGIALAVLLRDWRIVTTPWPWLAALAFLVGYANVIVYNAEQGFESLRSAQRIQAEYAQDQQAASGYMPTAGSMLLLLVRILGGAVDQRDGAAAYLADPAVLAVTALSVAGLLLLAARRDLLPLLACLSFLLILSAANPKFQTLLTNRYLMPIVPLLFACSALTLVSLAEVARRRGPVARREPLLVALVVGLVLVALPTISLDRYYRRAFERSDTNERILRLVAEVEGARRPGEVLLVDDGIGAELPDTGVTELRGLEYLLTFARVPYETIRPSPGRLQDSFDGQPTVLAILNARDASAAAGRVRVEPLDPRPPAETGRMFDFRLYRLSRDRA
jgi:4-amino-4-deoxy-L-arabinose transferase-like glycosyltransferase